MPTSETIVDPKERVRAMRELAQFYHSLGANLVPLGGDKHPVILRIWQGKPVRFGWKDWETTEQTDKLWMQIRAESYWGDVYGVAIVNGFAGWVNIDIDSRAKDDPSHPPVPRSVAEAFLQALELPDDYPWMVASPTGGWHVYVRVERLDIDKGKLDRPHAHPTVDHVELRYKGHYTALPGSLHPNGKLYAWANAVPTEAPVFVDGQALLDAYKSLTSEPPKPASSAPARPSSPSQHSAYVAKAVEAECDLVAHAASGSRNDTLNRSAHALGTLVGAGALAHSDAEQSLLNAALRCGLEEGEALATITSGLDAGMKSPRIMPESTYLSAGEVNDWIADLFTSDSPSPDDWDEENAVGVVGNIGSEKPHVSYPYAIDDKGRLVFWKETKEGPIAQVIADFSAVSVEEIHEEEGGKVFVLEGTALRGGSFRVEIPAEQFGDDRSLRKLLTAAAGSLDGLHAKMGEHLRPAIQRCSPSTIIRTQRFRRTGWADGRFLLPGRAQHGVLLALDSRKLPYGFTDEADLASGVVALDHLLRSVGPQHTTPILSQLLLAPLRRCVPKFMARPGLFVEGRTGSFKTTVVQTAMCLYGPRFLQDDALLKWGEGATRNAILSIAAAVQDLPLLVDNYKPNTGEGSKAFTNLVHNISEGTDRVRLDARSELRPSRPLHCLPIYTGEDIPDNDSATLARLLVVRFPRQDGGYNEHLAAARESAEHLQAVGEAWLRWLEVEANRTAAAHLAQSQWAKTYDDWRMIVLGAQPNVANAPRIITNLAMHTLAFKIAALCPVLQPIIDDYSLHLDGALQTVAVAMASRTTEAVDGSHFLSALRELLTSGQGLLLDRRTTADPRPEDRDRMIGWQDGSGVYLLPEIAVNAARRLLGSGSIPVSAQALYSQLEGLGVIADKGKDRTTKFVKVKGKSIRVLHLKYDAVFDDESVAPELYGL